MQEFDNTPIIKNDSNLQKDEGNTPKLVVNPVKKVGSIPTPIPNNKKITDYYKQKQQQQIQEPITNSKKNKQSDYKLEVIPPPIKPIKEYKDNVEFNPKNQTEKEQLINWFNKQQNQYPKEFFELDMNNYNNKYIISKKPVGKLIRDVNLSNSQEFEEIKQN